MKKELKMRIRTKHNPVEKSGTYMMKVIDAGLTQMPNRPYKDDSPVFKIFLEEVGGEYTLTDDHSLRGFYKTMAEIDLPERLLATKVKDLKLNDAEAETLKRKAYKPSEFVKMNVSERKGVLYTRPQDIDGTVYITDMDGRRIENERNTETCHMAFYSKMARIYGFDIELLGEGSVEEDAKIIAQNIIGKEVCVLIDQNRNGHWEVKAKGKESQLA